jgi:hypothetical protein
MSPPAFQEAPLTDSVGDPVLRQALAAALSDCATALAHANGEGAAAAADASSLRDLQEYLQAFIKTEGIPDDIRYSAFIVDMLISDAFRNFFGDLLYSKMAEDARIEACLLFATLCGETAMAVRDREVSAQAVSGARFVNQYLELVSRLNDAFDGPGDERGK